jgi:hypothetical protein
MIWDLTTIIRKNDKASKDVSVDWLKAYSEQAAKYCRLHIACRLLLDLVEANEPKSSPLWMECKTELEELLNAKGLKDAD